MMTRAVGTLSPGTLLYQGRYRIDLLLATTPHRAIYRAWNIARGRPSTIIELAPTSDQLATRALERAAPLVQLDHPALTAFQVVFVEHETVFIGMAFAGGQLVERIMDERNTPIQPAAAVRWISQAAEMLEFFASSLPTWHLGDISPSALFVTVEDRTQLLGFEGPLGLLTPPEIAEGLPPGAVAPELAQGTCDARSDVYALAASLYLLLTRQRWGGGDPATETALSAVAPPLPRALIEAVRRGLARDPGQRWPDAATFNSALLGAMAAPAETTDDAWWQSAPSAPQDDTQEMNRVDILAASAAPAAPPDTTATDPTKADPNTTLDRVPAHLFTDAADDDATTKHAAVTLPAPDEAAPIDETAPRPSVDESMLFPAALAASALTHDPAPSDTSPSVEVETGELTAEAGDALPIDAVTMLAQESAIPTDAPPAWTAADASPIVPPALLDGLASNSGELDPHGLEDMQRIDPAATVPPPNDMETPDEVSPPPTEEVTPPAMPSEEVVASAFAPVADVPPVVAPDAEAPSATSGASSDVEAIPAAAPEAPTEPAPEGTSTTGHDPWPWAAGAALGIAGVAGMVAATNHHAAPQDDIPAPSDAATVDATQADPSASTDAPSSLSDAADAPAPPSTTEAAAEDSSTTTPAWLTDAAAPTEPIAPSTTPFFADAWWQSTSPATPNEADAPANDEPTASTSVPGTATGAGAAASAEEHPRDAVTDAAPMEEAAPSDADQVNTWSRFADSVAPLTLAQAANLFGATHDTEQDAPSTPIVAPPDETPHPAEEVPATPPVTDPPAIPDHIPAEPMAAATAEAPAADPAPSPVVARTPSPFAGQSISAHRERYEPNMPPPGAKSRTPSRPLGNNNFFNRLRDLLGAPSEPAAALGTVVLPRHMYPQHSYSILVRLQTRPTDAQRTDDQRMAVVEVDAPANAFYLPVRRLALPIPPEGGLSEGTLAITALRPSAGTADRIIFTFKGTDGTVLHKGSYVADVTILTAQQAAYGEPMITLVHPLDIPA